MPRKTPDAVDETQFHEWVCEAYRRTAPQERFEMARVWCTNFTQPDALATALGLPPISLIVASLIDIQHPLLTCQRVELSYTAMVYDVLTAELKRLPVAIPICTQPPCGQPVDSLWTIVDNCQFVHR
jgi:hypothetical protein